MARQYLLEQLIEALRCLPSVGAKSAQRMAYFLLERDREGGRHLAKLLAEDICDLWVKGHPIGRSTSCGTANGDGVADYIYTCASELGCDFEHAFFEGLRVDRVIEFNEKRG